MARRNLKINYGTIQCVANEATKLSDSINSMKNSLNSINGIIQSCDGEAANALKEKQPDIIKNLDRLQRGLMGMSKIFNNYVESMCGIISYGSGGIDSIVHVSTDDVRFNLGQLIDLVESFDNFANGVQPSVSATNSFSLELSESDKMAVNQCNNRLNEVKDLMKITSSYIIVYEDDFEKFRKVILDYENMDDEFKNQIKDFYYDFADIKWYQTTAFKALVGTAIVVVALGVIVFVAPEGVMAIVLVEASKNAIAIGIINSVIEVIYASISGEDIADAVATGLFEGTIEGAILGGAETYAKSLKGAKYISKAASKLNISDNNLEFGLKLAGEYGGSIVNDAFKNKLNGEEVNWGNIAWSEAINYGWKFFDKKIGKGIENAYNKKATEILQKNIDNYDISDVAGQLLKNTGKKKLSQYGFEASFYTAKLLYSGEGAALDELMETGDYELSNMTDYISSKFDFVKLGKAMFKDDVKNRLKKLAGSLSLSK